MKQEQEITLHFEGELPKSVLKAIAKMTNITKVDVYLSDNVVSPCEYEICIDEDVYLCTIDKKGNRK